METPRKFIIIYYLRGVSTKLNKYIIFTMQTYKKLITNFNWLNFEGQNKVTITKIVFGINSDLV